MKKPFKVAVASWLATTIPVAAIAEVCDKSIPNWSPAEGPVTWYSEAANGLLLLIAIILLAIALDRNRILSDWVRIGGAISACLIFGLMSWVAFHDEIIEKHQVWRAQVQEGCISGYPIGTITQSLALVLSLFFLYRWVRNRRGDQEALYLMLKSIPMAAFLTIALIAVSVAYQIWIQQT